MMNQIKEDSFEYMLRELVREHGLNKIVKGARLAQQDLLDSNIITDEDIEDGI